MEKIPFKDYPNIETPIDAENLNGMQDNIETEIIKIDNMTKYITATAGSNGDFSVDIDNILQEGVILHIAFPTASNGSSNARLSIDGGSSYINIKLLRGSTTIPASLVQNQKFRLYYNGTNWIVDTSLIAYHRFTSAGVSSGDIPVDINADGGTYMIVVTGNGAIGFANDPGSLQIFYNADTNVNNYAQIRYFMYDTTIEISQGLTSAACGFMYRNGALNNINLALSEGRPIANCTNTLITTNARTQSLSYMQHYKNTVANITSLRFVTGNNMGVGTEIKVYKR